MDYPSAVHSRIEIPRSVWISSLWLRAALVALLVATWALAAAATVWTAASAIALLGGLGAAAFSFRRAYAALDGGVAPVPHSQRTPRIVQSAGCA